MCDVASDLGCVHDTESMCCKKPYVDRGICWCASATHTVCNKASNIGCVSVTLNPCVANPNVDWVICWCASGAPIGTISFFSLLI